MGFDFSAFRSAVLLRSWCYTSYMRRVLTVLFLCLIGCMGHLPPTSGGVYRTAETRQLVRWYPEDFPLTLIVDEDLPDAELEALQQAVFSWNDRLNSQVFYISENERVSWTSPEIYSPVPGTVLVLRGDIPDRTPGRTIQGQANLFHHDETGRMEAAIVFIDLAVPVEDAMIVLKHELGHVIGLRHDDWQGSIMFHSAVASGYRIMPDDRFFVYWQMTDHSPHDPLPNFVSN